VSEHSNLAGFANFNMLAGNPKHPIDVPGTYLAEPVLPPGFVRTSPLDGDAVEFALLEGSPAGIVGKSTYSFLGVAPELTLTLPPELSARPGLRLECDGRGIAASPSPAGARFELSMGARCRLSGEGPLQTADFEVGGYPVVASRHLLDDGPRPAGGTPTVIGFDDVISWPALREMASGHGGYAWDFWVATHQTFYRKSSHINNTVSGSYMAYTSSGHPATVASPEPFDFVSVHIGVTHREAEGGDVVIEGFRGGELRYSDRLRLRIAGPVRLLANWRGIDRLVVRHEKYWHAVVDDLELAKRN
jgi:hypothetical protein